MPLPIRAIAASALVALSACASPASGPAAAPTPAHRDAYVVVPPTGPREQTSAEQVHHVLDRLGFGARPGDVDRVRELGVDRWIALQLAPDRIDDQATDAFVASAYPAYHLPTADLVESAQAVQQAMRRRARDLAQRGDSEIGRAHV